MGAGAVAATAADLEELLNKEGRLITLHALVAVRQDPHHLRQPFVVGLPEEPIRLVHHLMVRGGAEQKVEGVQQRDICRSVPPEHSSRGGLGGGRHQDFEVIQRKACGLLQVRHQASGSRDSHVNSTPPGRLHEHCGLDLLDVPAGHEAAAEPRGFAEPPEDLEDLHCQVAGRDNHEPPELARRVPVESAPTPSSQSEPQASGAAKTTSPASGKSSARARHHLLSACTIGSAYASVFPLPVGAQMQTSCRWLCPPAVSCQTAAWTGNSSTIPSADKGAHSAVRRGQGTSCRRGPSQAPKRVKERNEQAQVSMAFPSTMLASAPNRRDAHYTSEDE